MTRLQSLAFERIEKLNDELQSIFRDGFTEKQVSCEFHIETIHDVKDKLSEQSDWIDALNREEHS